MALLNFPRTFRGWVLVQMLAAASLLGAQESAPTYMPPAPPPPLAAPPVATPPTTTTTTSAAHFAGERVREVRLEGASIDADVRLRQGIVQQTGEPLDTNKVRKSIQNLFATGRFANIRAEVEPAQQGQVDLVFVAEENFFVGRVTVDGIPRHGPSESQLVNATKLDLGELFEPQKLTVAIEGIQKVLRSQGFYRATVTVDEDRHAAIQQVDLRFHIAGGDRARVGTVVFEGDPGYSTAELLSITGLTTGDQVTSGKAQRAMERLRKKYNKQERLEAEVVLAKNEYQASSNTLDYTLKVNKGPKIDLQVKGASISKGRLKKYVPIYEENAVDDDLLNEGRRNIRDYFQTLGYFGVDVNFKQEPGGPDLRHVEYIIDKGERHNLSDLVIDGNKYFPEELLRERMLLQPKGWLLSHGRFSQSMLSRDVESITDLYKANGFQGVKVNGQVQDDYQGEGGRMRVAIHVVEGPQTLVRSLKIVGNNSVPESQLRDLLSTTEGQPYSDFNVATDRDSVVNYYFNHGFPDVGFEVTPVPVPGDASRMDVTFSVREGEPVFVDRVVITGLKYTKPYVVDRELEVHDGAPLSQADMLATQRRLYDLGIFNQVDLAVQNPEGAAREKNVLLQVTEAKRWTFNYGVGLEIATGSDPGATNSVQGRTGVSPRVSFDVTRINFLGRNHTLIFKSRLGRLQQRGLFSYEAPRFMNSENLKLTFTVFYDDTRDVRTFTAQRLEGSAQIEQKISKITTFLYRLTYRRVKVDPRTLVIDPGLIPLFSRPVRIGMPSFTYIRDKRDDALDTHKGIYTTADVGVAGRFLGSESSFSRYLIQNSTYYPFRKNWVFARSTKVGVIKPASSNDFIPLPERFFAGGGNSLRGFAINQAGPRDPETGFPLGGNAMFVNNIELRTPTIPLPFVENNLSAVIFHDMGNVFDTTGNMWHGLFRSSQPNRSSCELLTVTATCDFNYMSHAVGAGIRYKTPIGPVRFDLGYNVNPPLFPIRREARSDTLTHFNFFFSIGQSF